VLILELNRRVNAKEPSNASLLILVLLGNIKVNLETGCDRSLMKTVLMIKTLQISASYTQTIVFIISA
jgi:hypothetical protein